MTETEEPPEGWELEPMTVECLTCGDRVPNYARSLRDHVVKHADDA